MARRSNCVCRVILVLAGSWTFGVAGTASAQDFGGSSGSYLPYGGSGGGFVPYTAGPGGGLGIQPGMGPMAPASSRRSVMAGSMGQSLGAARTVVTPFGGGTSMGLGLGMGTPLIRRPTASGGMGGMGTGLGTRSPVGGYPFRQPANLGAPAAAGPGMSM